MRKVRNKNCYIDNDGHKYWYLEDDIQRPYTDDEEDINDQLYIKGKLCHREDGPACEYSDGDKEYFQYGKLHRISGPAREWSDGTKEYYENGKRHREDGQITLDRQLNIEVIYNIGYVISILKPKKNGNIIEIT